MANVSSSNGLEKRPKLAFRRADGSSFPSWSRTSLSSIIEPYSEKVYGEHKYEVLTSSREGLQRQVDHFGSEQRHDTDGYNVIPFGYCTYRNRSDDGRFAFNINTISSNAIVSKFYPVFRFTNANSLFMSEFLNSSSRAKKKLSVLAVGTSQVVLSFEALKAADFDLPCKDEQDKIASFFECLNRRIEYQRTLVDALKKYKRGVVRTLLTPDSCCIADATWTTAKIGDLGSFTKGAPLSKADIAPDGTPFILYGELYTTYHEVINAVIRRTQAQPEKQYYSRVGDVIIPTSGETPEEISTAACVMLPDIILAGDLNIFRSSKIDGRIMSYILNHIVNGQIARIAQGKSVVHIQASELSKIEISYPDYNTQRKMFKIFDALNTRTEIAQKKLMALRCMQKALLQQLFM